MHYSAFGCEWVGAADDLSLGCSVLSDANWGCVAPWLAVMLSSNITLSEGLDLPSKYAPCSIVRLLWETWNGILNNESLLALMFEA